MGIFHKVTSLSTWDLRRVLVSSAFNAAHDNNKLMFNENLNHRVPLGSSSCYFGRDFTICCYFASNRTRYIWRRATSRGEWNNNKYLLLLLLLSLLPIWDLHYAWITNLIFSNIFTISHYIFGALLPLDCSHFDVMKGICIYMENM